MVDLEAVRFGEHKNFKVKLIEAPSEAGVVASTSGARKEPSATPVTTTAKKLGVVVEALTPDVAKATGASSAMQGVAVQSVDHDGPAAQKLVPGDIITRREISAAGVEGAQRRRPAAGAGETEGRRLHPAVGQPPNHGRRPARGLRRQPARGKLSRRRG